MFIFGLHMYISHPVRPFGDELTMAILNMESGFLSLSIPTLTVLRVM